MELTLRREVLQSWKPTYCRTKKRVDMQEEIEERYKQELIDTRLLDSSRSDLRMSEAEVQRRRSRSTRCAAQRLCAAMFGLVLARTLSTTF